MINPLHSYRAALGDYKSALSYALLGIVGGIASGLIVLLFELAIVHSAALWQVGRQAEGFEALPAWLRLGLPVGGALLLGIAFSFLRPADREVGIVHLLSRLNTQYGILPARNAAVQFLAGAFALATGQSGGREGPGVHLGAAANSLLGQKLGLPNNSLRVLIACGTAGGIAAAFHTPLAGVIFAMEVIIAEYTVAGFLPVMLSAVSASAVSRYLTEEGTLFFTLPSIELHSLLEIPYIILLGAVCGLAMTLFIQISRFAARLSTWPVLIRFTLAGLLTGALAIRIPEIMGMGYDTLNLILQGEPGLAALALLVGAKLLATGFSCGVGMPVGLIGPSLLTGAGIGGMMGIVGGTLFPEHSSAISLYIVLGMAAAMGAVLSAPLAAILAVIELTDSVNAAMPALLAIVAAYLTNTGLFRQTSAHETVLRQLQRRVTDDPINQLLHRTHIASTMEISVLPVPAELPPEQRLPDPPPRWCLVQRDGRPLYMVQGAELGNWLEHAIAGEEQDHTDLTKADIRRWTVAPIPIQATLRQALDTMRDSTVEAVCVYGRNVRGEQILQGVVTRETIENFALARL